MGDAIVGKGVTLHLRRNKCQDTALASLVAAAAICHCRSDLGFLLAPVTHLQCGSRSSPDEQLECANRVRLERGLKVTKKETIALVTIT
jgi:hypothetical protein